MPLIEVQFNLEKVGEGLQFNGLGAEVTPASKRFVNTDLFLNVMETPNGALFACDYNTDLFDESTVARWMGVWEELVAGANADPVAHVELLPLLSAEQKELVLVKPNQTARDFGAFEPVPSAVARHAAQTPDAVAAVCSGREWTYAELNAFAQTLAQRLIDEGIKPGDVIGISLDRSVELVGSMLAVMLAGATYVPLDAGNPKARLDLIMADAGMSLVLSGRDPKIVSSLRRINVEEPREKLVTAPFPHVSPEELVYVLYTSGSTGVPKGVAVSHGALRNFLCSMRERPGFTQDDKLLAVTTVSFDIAEMELLLPLLCGGTVIIATEEESRDGMLLLDLLRRARATVMQATPGLWRVLLDAGWSRAVPLKVLCGGEALPRELADQLLAASADVWNMYGPTETTIWSAVAPVVPDASAPRIGGPIANTQFYVLDPNLQPVPLGVTAELYIGGDGLAEGYWHRPDLTAAAFLPNPVGPGLLYRTGDVGRWFPDGTIAIAGRSDGQVKLRGYRIELGEIEAAFRAQDDVVDAAVVQTASATAASVILVAFVQLKTPDARSVADLRLATQGLLPQYMQPTEIILVPAMPVTSNGKVDRKALRAGWNGEIAKQEFVAPATETEAALAGIWAELLGVNQVSVTESVFALGADSLTIFRIATRSQRDGYPVRAAQILAERTVRALARALEQGSAPAPVQQTRIKAVSRQRFLVGKDVVR